MASTSTTTNALGDFRVATQDNVVTLNWVIIIPSPVPAITAFLAKLQFPPDVGAAVAALKKQLDNKLKIPPALKKLADSITALEAKLQRLVKYIPDLKVKLTIKIGTTTVFEKTFTAQQFLAGCIPQVGGIK